VRGRLGADCFRFNAGRTERSRDLARLLDVGCEDNPEFALRVLQVRIDDIADDAL
jgi:hypothetical protein